MALGWSLNFCFKRFFILPAFFEKNLTVVDSLTGGYSDYRFHFIYLRQLWRRSWGYGGSIFGLEDDISFQFGWSHLLLILPAVRLWRRQIYFWLALGLSIFMMTFHSQFIWDRVPILALAQFPWRLLAFAGVFVAFLAGSSAKIIKNKYLIPALIILIIALNINYFRPEKFAPVEDYYYTDRRGLPGK